MATIPVWLQYLLEFETQQIWVGISAYEAGPRMPYRCKVGDES